MNRSFLRMFLVLFVVILFTYCPKNIGNSPSKATFEELEAKTPYKVSVVPKSSATTANKIKVFRSRIYKEHPLSKETWKLHDELLAEYKRLKHSTRVSGTKFSIPSHSKLFIPFRSFCLNSSRSAPHENEHFIWKNDGPKIPYFDKIIHFYASHPEIEQSRIQTLLWNLGNGTYFEDYPDDLKSILKSIDPMVPYKLPSQTKTQAGSFLKGWVRDYVQGAEKVEETVSNVRSSFADYKDIAENVAKLTSEYSIEPVNIPQEIIPQVLYADTKGDGYRKQNVIFYNPSDKDVEFDTSEIYLQPSRPDVQRIGLIPDFGIANEDSSLLNELEQVLFEDMLRLGIGFTPGLNDVADLYEVLSGKDFVSGENLTHNERFFSALGLVVGSGADYRYANRYLSAPDRFVKEFETGFSNVTQKDLHSLSRSNAPLILSEAETVLKNGRLSESNKSAIRSLSEEWRKTGITHEERSRMADGMRLETLKREIAAPENNVGFYRWYGGDAEEIGRWGGVDLIHDKVKARDIYALPDTNTMENIAKFRLKNGSAYYISEAQSLFGRSGGGKQIFVPNRNNLIPIR